MLFVSSVLFLKFVELLARAISPGKKCSLVLVQSDCWNLSMSFDLWIKSNTILLTVRL